MIRSPSFSRSSLSTTTTNLPAAIERRRRAAAKRGAPTRQRAAAAGTARGAARGARTEILESVFDAVKLAPGGRSRQDSVRRLANVAQPHGRRVPVGARRAAGGANIHHRQPAAQRLRLVRQAPADNRAQHVCGAGPHEHRRQVCPAEKRRCRQRAAPSAGVRYYDGNAGAAATAVPWSGRSSGRS